MDNIYIGCRKCDNKSVDVMSVRKGKAWYDDRFVSTAIITYVCCDCGWSEIDEHYLYGEN